jgi:60 kDa SS-A/Ro ribonucleoprotein
VGTNYADIVSSPSTVRQNQVIPGREKDMTLNHSGAYVFELDCWKRLNRFLILGVDSPTMYQSEKELVMENYACVLECLNQDPMKTIAMINSVSKEHRAPKNESALFAMILATAHKDATVRQAAYRSLSEIIRYGTDLLYVMNVWKKLRKSSMGFRKAITRYYENLGKDPERLAKDLLRFKNRNEWKQTDVIRMIRWDGGNETNQSILKYIFKGESDFRESGKIPKIILGEIAIKEAGDDVKLASGIIEEFGLPRELVPTHFHTQPEIWKSMLPNLKYVALMRNLNHLTRLGVITNDARNADTQYVINTLTNEDEIKRAKVHPLNLLVTMLTYAKGRGVRGDTTWTPIPAVTNALHDALLKSYRYTDKLNINVKIAIDSSGSMFWDSSMTKSGLYAGETAMAMAAWLVKQEDFVSVEFFSNGTVPTGINKSTSIFEMIKLIRESGHGGTNCAAPIIDAINKRQNVDLFCVFTDNETNGYHAGHASEYLKKYRAMFNKDAKMVVVGMTATDCSIADPNDPGMLDVAGFDASLPQIIEAFVKGW